MKLSKLISPMQDHDSDQSTYVMLNEDGSGTQGIILQAYYNVRISGTDMGSNACNYVFSRLPGYHGAVVRRCNDVHGCYRRVNYTGAGGIAALRGHLDTIIGPSIYDVEAEVNTRASCS